jgi:TolA-binding protein
MTRAIKDFGAREYAPDYHLVLAEQAFRTKNNTRAMSEYSFVIQNYPRSHAAVDSAFRKAFILFRQNDFKGAFQVYSILEKFHSDEIEKLKLEAEIGTTDKLVDRAFYAETIFQNGKYTEAAKLFQDLGNIFPTHPTAPFILYRLGDTYLYRGQVKAAEELYRYVLERHKSTPLVQAVGLSRLADLYFLTKDRKVAKYNEKYWQESFENAHKVDNDEVAALALAKLSLHYLTFEVYPRAQATLKQYRSLYRESLNQEWVEKKYVEMVELEILDYYQHEDYLAALAVYLSHEREHVFNFTDTRVLLNLADAAKRLGLIEKSTQILNRVIYLEKSSEGRQEALLRLVDLFVTQSEFRKASERLRRFSFAYPTTPLRHLYELAWGNLYLGMKNSEQAAFHYEKSLQSVKQNATAEYEIRHVYMRLAGIYEQLILTEKAIESYERFIKVVHDRTDNKMSAVRLTKKDEYLLKVAHQKIADMHFSLRDYPRAIDSYRAVVQNVPDEPFQSHARYRIGECYLALNDRPAALEAFKKVNSDDANNIWVKAAQSYIASVELEVKYGIRIFN